MKSISIKEDRIMLNYHCDILRTAVIFKTKNDLVVDDVNPLKIKSKLFCFIFSRQVHFKSFKAFLQI